jgi:hypothetical protein
MNQESYTEEDPHRFDFLINEAKQVIIDSEVGYFAMLIEEYEAAQIAYDQLPNSENAGRLREATQSLQLERVRLTKAGYVFKN